MKWIKGIRCRYSSISPDCLAVCLYILFLPATAVETPFGSLLKLVTMPVIGILSYKLLFGRSKPLRFNTIQLLFSLYTLYTVWQLLLLYTDTSWIIAKDMVLTLVALLLITVRVYSDIERDLMEKTWILVGIICLYFSFFSSREIGGEGRTSVYILGFYEDPNQFCGYFIMPVMIAIKRILAKSRLVLFYLVYLVLILYSVLRTGSRGGLIGILVGIAVYLLIGIPSWKKKISLALIGLLFTVFVVTVVFPLLPEDVQERYSVETVAEDKGSGRFEIWQYLIRYTLEKPERIIRGMGVYSTADTMSNSGLGLSAKWAHNQLVQVFADQGIIGLFLFLSFAVLCFFRNIKKNPEYACAFIAIMALSLSLSLYVFKPYINVVMMCSMTFEEG